MKRRSFLSVFRSIGEAVTAAAQIAAPIVATFDPQIGGLMSGAAAAAVGVEAAITSDASGASRAAAVAAQTKAAIDVVNGILESQGKPKLPAHTGDVIASQVGVVVAQLNGVRDAVQLPPASAAPPALLAPRDPLAPSVTAAAVAAAGAAPGPVAAPKA